MAMATTPNEQTETISNYYNSDVEREWSRLDRHPFEFELTKRHIKRYLKPNARIADIGGGPGKYALHYSAQGHDVTLVDISERSIARATAEATRSGVPLYRALVGNATDLSRFPSDSFDLTLCMGPIYHLPKRDDRIRAIRECTRITKDDGFLVFAFVSVFAHAIPLATRNPERIGDLYSEMTKPIIEQCRPDGRAFGFTIAHYSHPDEIEGELSDCGLALRVMAGVEMIGGVLESQWDTLSDDARARWMDYCFAISTDPTVRGMSQHLIAVCSAKRSEIRDSV